MVIIIKVIALLYVCLGIYFFKNPRGFKHYIQFWQKGNRIYLGGAFASVFVTIFLLAASQCRWPAFLYVLGSIGLLKIILIFTLGATRLKNVLQWWDKRALFTLRIIGLIVILIGALMLYAA